jgi:predicted Rossmann fold flavoprotein
MVYDVIVIGAGASGIISAIEAAKNNKKVLILEKLPQIASKLKATGGGRCNLTNTLSNEEFMKRFGKNGRFMQEALEIFDKNDLVEFFASMGVETHAPDGFRIFPTSHSSKTIIEALKSKIDLLGIELKCSCRIDNIIVNEAKEVCGVKCNDISYISKNVILASGALGYPSLGSDGDGYEMAKNIGHHIEELYPAMLPLHTKERWVENCRADTIAKATIKVDMKKHKKLQACGDLIFTKNGIRGPVVLDFAREITPLVDKYKEVPVLINMTSGMDEDKILKHLKKYPENILEAVCKIVPKSIAVELLNICEIGIQNSLGKIEGFKKQKLISMLAWTPLNINGHDGFKNAMITCGGISLKEIDPKTMQSKLIKGLYFCGEIVNIDGPCGGYNLQWAFSSGYLAGKLK